MFLKLNSTVTPPRPNAPGGARPLGGPRRLHETARPGATAFRGPMGRRWLRGIGIAPRRERVEGGGGPRPRAGVRRGGRGGVKEPQLLSDAPALLRNTRFARKKQAVSFDSSSCGIFAFRAATNENAPQLETTTGHKIMINDIARYRSLRFLCETISLHIGRFDVHVLFSAFRCHCYHT